MCQCIKTVCTKVSIKPLSDCRLKKTVNKSPSTSQKCFFPQHFCCFSSSRPFVQRRGFIYSVSYCHDVDWSNPGSQNIKYVSTEVKLQNLKGVAASLLANHEENILPLDQWCSVTKSDIGKKKVKALLAMFL